MKASIIRRVLVATASTFVLCTAGMAHAALFRAYLSVNGSDANACTLPAPCRLLPAALTAVNAGGEIWMLDSANFNTAPVTITKSVTILAVPGALGSVVANGGDAIVINTPNVSVTLRNLVILNLSGGTVGATGLNGITFFDGAALTVEDCEIYGMSGRGMRVFVASFARIAIKRTVVRDNGFRNVAFSGPLSVTMDGVHVLNSPIGVFVGQGVNMTLSNSVVAGGNDGNFGVAVYASTDAVATVNLAIENSVMRGSDTGLLANSDGGGTLVSVSRSTFSQNGTGIMTTLTPNVGGGTVVVLSGSMVSHNGASGVNTTGGGAVQTLQNNVFQFNNVNVNGTLTSLPAL